LSLRSCVSVRGSIRINVRTWVKIMFMISVWCIVSIVSVRPICRFSFSVKVKIRV
jgi:hypothetical protein